MSQSAPNAAGADRAGEIATLRAKIDRQAIILLGTFGTEGRPGALLRLPSGQVQKIAAGDKVSGRTVLAISNGTVVLASGSGSQVLHAPRPAGEGATRRSAAPR